MKNEPLVSVIMPVYNVENYVEKAINSVLNQEYDNIELICINDCSTDGSFEKCRQMSGKSNKIRLLDNDSNLGIEYTRNRGIQVARGEYMMFVDSDDFIDSKMISMMVSIAESSQVDISMCGYATINKGKKNIILAKSVPEGTMEISSFASYVLKDFSWALLSCVGTKLYRSQVIRDKNILFESEFKYNEDGAFIMKVLMVANKVAYINQAYYNYYIRNGGSIMTSYRPHMFSSIVKVNELVRDFFENNAVFDSNKIYYYRKLFFLMLDTLMNEAKFGTRQTYVEASKTLVNYYDFDNMCNVLLSSRKINRKYIYVVKLFQSKNFRLLYYLLVLKEHLLG